MKNRRLAIAGLALATALGLAGCGTDSDQTATNGPSAGGAASAGAQAQPGPGAGSREAGAELVAAASKLAESTVKIDTKMGDALSMNGALDPKAAKVKMAMVLGTTASSTRVDVIQIGNDMYLKFDGPLAKVVGGSWMHVDATKLKAGNSFNQLQGNDPAGTRAMTNAMTNVQKTGDHDFTGTLDLTKTPQYNKDSMKGLGAKASAVPFTAKTDAEGRLVELNVELQTILPGAGTMRSTYSGFGTKVDVEKPEASKVKELPANMTGLLNA
jgi:hypothetical protein